MIAGESIARLRPTGPEEIQRLGTEELRSRFLLTDLFAPGELRLALTDLDRMVVGAALPSGELTLPACSEFGTRYFTEKRELGIINIGDPGVVRVGDRDYELARLDCLYVGIEEPHISFASCGAGSPAFYFLSCPAHRKCETRKIGRSEANIVDLGDAPRACRRRIVQYICPARIASCQLMMGFTELEPNSVWNTMPAHTHTRRSEVYLYFDLDGGMAVHLTGEPHATRHLIVRDRQVVLSPSWSIHSGVATQAYRFVWGMAGENQDFRDFDAVATADLF